MLENFKEDHTKFIENDEEGTEWFPADYNPNINKEEWIDLLNNKRVFRKSSLEIMKRMKDHGGMATCTQLSIKYGEAKNFYNAGSSSLAQRVADETGCSKWITKDKERWWPILYVGKYAPEETEGVSIWKLRDELSEALDEIDLSNIQLYANFTTWCISANLDKYNVVEAFDNLKKINWRQSTNISVGDIVYIYLSKPVQAIQYKCYVNAVDLESQEIDDREYYVDQEFNLDYGRFMELELLDSFTTSAYELKYLEKQDFSIPQGPFRIKPKTKSYLKLLEKLKNIEEMEPDKHDGSYELVRETIRAYASLKDFSIIDYHDLNLVYLMSIGTWRHGIDSKRRSVEKSNLPHEEQERLNFLLTEVWEKAKENEYENHENGGPNIGMFGTGFNSFKGKADKDSPRNFIKMCIDILDLKEDKEIFDRCQTVLTKDFSGMAAASASVVLHCLKPFTFPIFNSNQGSDNIFVYLGIPLTQIGHIDTYIENCRQVKKFRDDNFTIKNYRIFDRVAKELDNEEKHTSIDYLGVLDYLENNRQIPYSNPDKDEIEEKERQRLLGIKAKAQMAIKEMKNMASLCEERFGLDVLVPMSWLDASNTKTRTYLWAQMKKSEHEKNPISVSIFVEFSEETKKARYRYCLEIRNDGADKEMLEKYHRHLDIPMSHESDFVYVAGSNEYGVPGQIITDIESIKQRVADGTYEKVQPSYIVEQTHNLTNDDIEKEMLKAMEELVSVYDYVLNDLASKEIEDEETMKWDNKNLIIYGPPGTGKTYKSRIYALAICEEKEIEELEEEEYKDLLARYNELEQAGRVAFTTFHQSYSYEEFIEGIKPEIDQETENISYQIKSGLFKQFCEAAEANQELPFVFIIDEINRGNISKIFGELITLIEDNKRQGELEAVSLKLPYSKKPFTIPNNVYLLGTMNTADRSIALMDTALRRRFQFVEMMPEVEVLHELGIEKIDQLDIGKMLETINERITFLYDREHTIGHSFFTTLKGEQATIENLADIFEKSIIPLLQEYFYEDYEKIQLVLGDNEKSKDEFKFIKDKNIDARTIFKGNIEDKIDLPEKSYAINKEAFTKIESYLEIYRISD